MDLTKGISIRIAGEMTKHNTLPIEVLLKLASNLQELILEVAKADLSDEEVIKLNNFKIELSGFKVGSAVPEFVFTKEYQSSLGIDVIEQQKKVNDKLSKVISISSSGDFRKISKEFPNPISRNGVLKSLHGFINSVGKAPISIVNEDLTPEYEIQRFPKKAMESLFVDIEQDIIKEEKSEVKTMLAKIEDSGGRGRKRIIQTYSSKVTPTFDPDIINYQNYQYELRVPLRSKVSELEGKFIIENELLGIYAYGENMDEAEEVFASEFDYLYTRYNQLNESKLSSEAIFIRDYLNNIVSKHG